MSTAPAETARYRLVGALAVAGGAMLFASKGILAKLLYARGVHYEAVVVVRAVLAMPMFWLFAWAREPTGAIRSTRPRAVAAAATAGVLCYYVGALTDFYALTLIDASIERVLLFSYPAIVVAVTAIHSRRPPSRAVVLAIAITWIGIFFTMGGFQPEVLRANAVGAAFVMISALTYAGYFLVGGRYTREIGSSRFTLIAMSAAAIVLAIDFMIRSEPRQLADIDAPSWLMLAVLAVLCMFVPALMQAEGIRRVGAQNGAIFSTAGPPTTIVLGSLFLGERMTGGQLAGVALIVVGVLVLDLARIRNRPAR